MTAVAQSRYRPQVSSRAQPHGFATRPELRLVWSRPTKPRLDPSIYRRRRIASAAMAGLLVAVVCLGVSWIQAGASASPTQAGAPAGSSGDFVSITVGPGDSLWSIASQARPGGDVRPLVAELSAQHGPVLDVGDVVRIPAG